MFGPMVSKVVTNGFGPAGGEGGIIMGFDFLEAQGWRALQSNMKEVTDFRAIRAAEAVGGGTGGPILDEVEGCE